MARHRFFLWSSIKDDLIPQHEYLLCSAIDLFFIHHRWCPLQTFSSFTTDVFHPFHRVFSSHHTSALSSLATECHFLPSQILISCIPTCVPWFLSTPVCSSCLTDAAFIYFTRWFYSTDAFLCHHRCTVSVYLYTDCISQTYRFLITDALFLTMNMGLLINYESLCHTKNIDFLHTWFSLFDVLPQTSVLFTTHAAFVYHMRCLRRFPIHRRTLSQMYRWVITSALSLITHLVISLNRCAVSLGVIGAGLQTRFLHTDFCFKASRMRSLNHTHFISWS